VGLKGVHLAWLGAGIGDVDLEPPGPMRARGRFLDVEPDLLCVGPSEQQPVRPHRVIDVPQDEIVTAGSWRAES
jgi:hypothetical protein